MPTGGRPARPAGVDHPGAGARRGTAAAAPEARARPGAGAGAGGDAGVMTAPPKGPLVGYRCWVAERGRLRSATSSEYWPGGILEARCGENEPHAAPEITCRCGI